VNAAVIQKRVAFLPSTLLTQNNGDVKVVPELPRHVRTGCDVPRAAAADRSIEVLPRPGDAMSFSRGNRSRIALVNGVRSRITQMMSNGEQPRHYWISICEVIIECRDTYPIAKTGPVGKF
jgi:hypothetical protein